MKFFKWLDGKVRKTWFVWTKHFLSMKYRRFRKQNLGKYIICSLGWNCLPRMLPTEWRLKANKKMGELSCPFDLAGHQAKVVADVIEKDFAGYLDDVIHYTDDRKFMGEYKADFFNPNYGIMYVHDEDCQTLEDFKKRYVARVENFRRVLSGDKPVLFVYNARKDTSPNRDTHDEIQKLCDVVMSRVHNKKSRFVVISPYDVGEIKGAHMYLSTWPVADYNWWVPLHRRTLYGIRWERKVMEFLYSELCAMLKDCEE